MGRGGHIIPSSCERPTGQICAASQVAGRAHQAAADDLTAYRPDPPLP